LYNGKSNLVQADIRNAKLPNIDESKVYLKYARLEEEDTDAEYDAEYYI